MILGKDEFWEHEEDSGFIVISDSREIVCQMFNKHEENFNHSEVNARLIENAPDMFRALKYFVDRVEEGSIRSKKTYAMYKNLIERIGGSA